jgi:DNA-binding NtrC family response regulator
MTGKRATSMNPKSLTSSDGIDAAADRLDITAKTHALLSSVADLNMLLAEGPSTPGGSRLIVDDDETSLPGSLAAIVQQAGRIAASKAAVLIEGESGTGKELIARLIHFSSPRRTRPFVRVNCAALSENLVESEMFGHERGAYTGAGETRIGRFELASGGTILLDEISEMSVKLQAKLLRVLEEEEFERVGGMQTLKTDIRVIATTNRDLRQEIQAGRFRRDLYYRINIVQLHLPPLRLRRHSIPGLAVHFIRQFRHESASQVRGISAAALQALRTYDWPGNVRQLRNIIHRACIMASGEQIQISDLPPLEDCSQADSIRGKTLEEIERQAILATLQEVGGNKTAAARRLGVTARTLLNKLTKYRSQA